MSSFVEPVVVISCVYGRLTLRHAVVSGYFDRTKSDLSRRDVSGVRDFSLSLSYFLSSLFETVTFTCVSASILIRLREDFDYLHSSSTFVRMYVLQSRENYRRDFGFARVQIYSTIHCQLLVSLSEIRRWIFGYVRVFSRRESITRAARSVGFEFETTRTNPLRNRRIFRKLCVENLSFFLSFFFFFFCILLCSCLQTCMKYYFFEKQLSFLRFDIAWKMSRA